MAIKEVIITVLDADGDMSYSRSVAHASVGDTINFKAGLSTAAFKLTFATALFNEGQLLESGGPTASATGTVKNGSPTGRYYYGVSALYTVTNLWYNDPGCPEIIVK